MTRRLLLFLAALAIPGIAEADTLKLPNVGVTVTVPAGWKLRADPDSDVLVSGADTIALSRQPEAGSCRALIEHAALVEKSALKPAPAFARAPWYDRVVEAANVPGMVVGCVDSGGVPVAVIFQMTSTEAPAILASAFPPIEHPPETPVARSVTLPVSKVTLALPATGFESWVAVEVSAEGGRLDQLVRAGTPELTIVVLPGTDKAASEGCAAVLAPTGKNLVPAPSFLPRTYHPQVVEMVQPDGTRGLTACTPSPMTVVLITIGSGVPNDELARLGPVLAALQAGLAPSATAPVVASPPPPSPTPPTTASAVATLSSNASWSPGRESTGLRLLRRLRDGLRFGVGYDRVQPADMSTLATSHYKMVQVEDAIPVAGGDLVGGLTVGVGDQAAYDAQLSVGPTVRLLGVGLSALIGVGFDSVGGTAMQFSQGSGVYVQFLARGVLQLPWITLTGSAAVLDRETRETADLVIHLPHVVNSISFGVRFTQYELASRAGAMVMIDL